MRVVTAWRGLDPPGRFLQKTNPDLGDDSFWHDVGEKEARKKASQCLRERTADIAPILKKLGQEQVIEEEKQSMKKKVPPKRESKKLTATAQTDTQKQSQSRRVRASRLVHRESLHQMILHLPGVDHETRWLRRRRLGIFVKKYPMHCLVLRLLLLQRLMILTVTNHKSHLIIFQFYLQILDVSWKPLLLEICQRALDLMPATAIKPWQLPRE